MNKIQLDAQIFIIEDFLTLKECSDYIEKSELQSFEEAKVNMGGTQVMLKGVRNNDRLLFFDENLAETLWSKIEPFVPSKIGSSEAIGLNEMFRIYRYNAGQRFKMHRDGSYERNETEFSILSFLIYLNDDYEGGETEFRKIITIKPKTGMALVFHHPLRHEGKEIISGTKYVLRTDIMYKLEK
ncbi:2OG-Fe(II) oxygenase [Winogradskyella sp. SYSU M77433]|uniref:prolyl hydroxylase family protein n=1 Tax=Winogradskyella sp. SYSU M77433 TaxID=3042722 RepID=UPI00248041BC|nr:2OG-Fe(II) oxygenase [Winogradskyella sp. SYSU M77433]MDH7911881.1 2OG-Fe(II) oxygenase [Winogradskyella sp. SYSU M77433]